MQCVHTVCSKLWWKFPIWKFLTQRIPKRKVYLQKFVSILTSEPGEPSAPQIERRMCCLVRQGSSHLSSFLLSSDMCHVSVPSLLRPPFPVKSISFLIYIFQFKSIFQDLNIVCSNFFANSALQHFFTHLQRTILQFLNL